MSLWREWTPTVIRSSHYKDKHTKQELARISGPACRKWFLWTMLITCLYVEMIWAAKYHFRAVTQLSQVARSVTMGKTRQSEEHQSIFLLIIEWFDHSMGGIVASIIALDRFSDAKVHHGDVADIFASFRLFRRDAGETTRTCRRN